MNGIIETILLGMLIIAGICMFIILLGLTYMLLYDLGISKNIKKDLKSKKVYCKNCRYRRIFKRRY